MTPKEIHGAMLQILAEDSHAIVKKKAADLKRSGDRTGDDPQSSRLKTLTTHEQVDVIRRMVLNARRLTVLVRANSIGISSVLVYTVLT